MGSQLDGSRGESQRASPKALRERAEGRELGMSRGASDELGVPESARRGGRIWMVISTSME